MAYAVVPRPFLLASRLAAFFAGFCLIANGVYIGLGSFGQVGDCKTMLQTGSPLWTLWAFGALSAAVGGYLWHKLGSVAAFFSNSHRIAPRAALIAVGVATFLWTAGAMLLP